MAGKSGQQDKIERHAVLHRLTGTKKAHELCRLVEALYLAGRRVTVWVSDPSRAATLDEYLWTFAQHSFIPHGMWNGGDPMEDPVVVVTGTLGNPNGSEVLVVGDTLADPSLAAGWSEVHDLVTAAAEDAGKNEAWAAAGFTVREARGIGAGKASV
ncbi:MAG: DNA polymerase III subunit chi [Thermoanaerobaculales bacterium]